jgi:hypothetical protein
MGLGIATDHGGCALKEKVVGRIRLVLRLSHHPATEALYASITRRSASELIPDWG